MYKQRRAVLMIDLTQLQEWDAFTLGAILQELPEDTKIISFGDALSEGKLAFVIENERFKEVHISESYPRVYVTETHRADCSAIMEMVEEKKKQPPDELTSANDSTLYGIHEVDWSKLWKSHPFTYKLPSYNTIRKAQETAFSKNNGMLEFATIENMFSEPRSVTAPSIELSYPKGTRLTTQLKPICVHTWKPYEGLTEKYEFCVNCNERKA